MSATTSSTASEGTEFTIDVIMSAIDVTPQPAEAIVEAFDGFGDILAYAETDDDWEEIDGVGPATAETLEENIDALEDLVSAEPATEPSVEPDSDDDVESEPAEETSSPNEQPEPEVDTDEDDEAGNGDGENADDGDDSEAEEGEGEEEEGDDDTDDEEGLTSGLCHKLRAETTAKALREFVDPVTRFVDESRIHIESSGLFISAVDPANVGMVDGSITEDTFNDYSVQPGVIGVNVDRFQEVLKMGDADDTVVLELDDQNRKLNIEIEGLEFSMALIDPDSIRQEPELPGLDLSATIEMHAPRFKRAVKATDMVSDHLAIGVDQSEQYLYFDAEGDTDGVHDEVEITECEQFDGADVEALFSLEYIKKIKQSLSRNDSITLELGDNFPVNATIQPTDGVEHTVMIAPRIQSE